VTEFLNDRPNISLIKQPGNSLDLHTGINNNMKGCKRKITRLWVTQMDNFHYLKNMVELIVRRLQKVIEKDGGVTKY
jgi:hypothetical protein